jgi:hypothetical protein
MSGRDTNKPDSSEELTKQLSASEEITAELKSAAEQGSRPLVWATGASKPDVTPKIVVPNISATLYIAVFEKDRTEATFHQLLQGINEFYKTPKGLIGMALDSPVESEVLANIMVDLSSGMAQALAGTGGALSINGQPIQRKHKLSHNDWLSVSSTTMAFVEIQPPSVAW